MIPYKIDFYAMEKAKMSLKPSDIGDIIYLVTQIAEDLSKTDFLSLEERKAINFDKTDLVVLLKDKLSKAKQKYIESTIEPLQKELDLFLTPRWPEILRLSTRKQFRKEIEAFLYDGCLTGGFIQDTFTFSRLEPIGKDYSSVFQQKKKVVDELKRIKVKLEYEKPQVPAETEQNTTPAKRGRIGAWLWKFFEVNIKSFWDAFWKNVIHK